MESTLSSSCFRSDPSLSRQGAALAHLDSLPLVIRYSGQTALFLFLLAKAAPAFLPTALSVALRPLFPFRQAQYAQVFPLKPALFCTLFAGLGSTNKSAISFLFSYYLTLVATCPLLHLSFYLKLCGRSGKNLATDSLARIKLRTLCTAHSLATLCLSTTSGPDPGELPSFWGSMVFAMPPSLGRGWVTNSNSNNTKVIQLFWVYYGLFLNKTEVCDSVAIYSVQFP